MTLNLRGLQNKLSRTTSSGNYIAEIDGLRCLAICAVIAFHLAGYVADKSPVPFSFSRFDAAFFQILRTGHIGVQLFFVISGFVVALPFAMHHLAGAKQVNLKHYFLRRLLRIEPPYVIALFFWLFAFGISGLGEAPLPVLLQHFPASLFYVHNLIYHQPSYVLPPAWSLEIEIQFYLLAPLLTLIFAISTAWARRAMLLVAIATFAMLQRWLRVPDQINGLGLHQELQYFLSGLLLADLYVIRWKNTPPRHPGVPDCLATCSLLVLPIELIFKPADQLLITFTLLLFVASVLRSRYWRGLFQVRSIYTFGGMCYTTYLYHGFFKALPGHFTVRWQIGHTFWLNFLLQTLLLMPIIVAGSIFLFVLTEKPFMNRRKDLTEQMRIKN